MRKIILFAFFLFPFIINAEESLIQNVYSRDHITLNRSWNYIIDPFDMGYYGYRLQENPNIFFKNRNAQSKTDLLEYNFDTSPFMVIHSDWNTKNRHF